MSLAATSTYAGNWIDALPGICSGSKSSSYKSLKQIPPVSGIIRARAINRHQNSGNLSSAGTEKPRAFRLTQSEWRALSRSAFREHTHGKAKPAHVISEECECSPKTAQAWLDGESTPAGILDLRAMHAIPAYAALKREIANLETTLDPRLQAKYQELHRLTLQLANGSA